jgi:16S rRNA (cytosine1402-N4)-methyltransferase
LFHDFFLIFLELRVMIYLGLEFSNISMFVWVFAIFCLFSEVTKSYPMAAMNIQRIISRSSSLRVLRSSSSLFSMIGANYHTPVMVNECLQYLNIEKDKVYIDCTLGGGGHSFAILEKGGRVIGLDQDMDAIQESTKRLRSYIEDGRMEILQTNFRNLKKVPQLSKIANGNPVDGILMDLGISSHQVDDSARGFSFSSSGPLDMRMNQNSNGNGDQRTTTVTAKEIVNNWNHEDLANLIFIYGEETRSRKIAREIIDNRPLETTEDLKKAISRVIPYKERPKVLARCFQAMRIFINDEMKALSEALSSAESCLKIGGRLVVLSYHSLEDRKVKYLFRKGIPEAANDDDEPENEEDTSNKKSSGWKILTKKGIEPSKAEVELNNRSRSAKLRAGEKSDPNEKKPPRNKYKKMT